MNGINAASNVPLQLTTMRSFRPLLCLPCREREEKQSEWLSLSTAMLCTVQSERIASTTEGDPGKKFASEPSLLSLSLLLKGPYYSRALLSSSQPLQYLPREKEGSKCESAHYVGIRSPFKFAKKAFM